MTFDEVITEICYRVNDPDKDTYGDRAEQLFIQSVCELAVTPETRKEEMQSLIVDLAGDSVEFQNGEGSVDIPYGTLRVLDVYIEPEDLVTSALILKAIDHEDVKRMNLEPAFEPAGSECFWYRVGNTIRFLLSSDWDGAARLNFTIEAIESPDSSDWTDDDMTANHGFSSGFIYKAIDGAVAKLRAEL